MPMALNACDWRPPIGAKLIRKFFPISTAMQNREMWFGLSAWMCSFIINCMASCGRTCRSPSALMPGLHFETCYHQGIEYCIRAGLQRFEPGTQGEHKVSRGFGPELTWSAHWIADPRFARAIGDYLRREALAVDEYAAQIADHVPFKQRGPTADAVRAPD